MAWLELGRVEDALMEIRNGEAALRAAGYVLKDDLPVAEAHLASAHRRPGSDLAAEARLRVAEAREGFFFLAERHRIGGERLLSSSEPDEVKAEACFRRAMEIAREQEAKMLELRAATSLARLWAKQGKRQKAHDLLANVYDWFTEGFDTADLKDAKALLDEFA